MHLANILTVIRIIFIPIFIGLYYFENSLDHNNPQYVQTSNFYSYLIFTIAAVTDLFDGWIARKYKQMTKFGAFLDPVADILLPVAVFQKIILAVFAFPQHIEIVQIVVSCPFSQELKIVFLPSERNRPFNTGRV